MIVVEGASEIIATGPNVRMGEMALEIAKILFDLGLRSEEYPGGRGVSADQGQTYVHIHRQYCDGIVPVLVPMGSENISACGELLARALMGYKLHAVDLEIPSIGVIEAAIGRYHNISIRGVTMEHMGTGLPFTRFDVLHSPEEAR